MTHSLSRDILLAITIKLALLGTLYLCLVRPIGTPPSDDRATAAAVAGAAADLPQPERSGVRNDRR